MRSNTLNEVEEKAILNINSKLNNIELADLLNIKVYYILNALKKLRDLKFVEQRKLKFEKIKLTLYGKKLQKTMLSLNKQIQDARRRTA